MWRTPGIVWLILLAGLVLRVATAFVVADHVEAAGRRFLIEGDANGYWELATRLATGQEYCIHHPPRYVLRTPGFPLLLAGSICLFGDSVFAASLMLAVVGTLCVWLTWILARICLEETPAAVAAGLMAVAPLQTGNSVLILSETWFAFWLLLCLILLTQLLRGDYFRRRSAPGPTSAAEELPSGCVESGQEVSGRQGMFGGSLLAFASGVVTGITVLVRPGWILWTGVSGLIVLFFGRGPVRRRLLAAVVISCGCVVALAPWAWRNHRITGHWIMTSLWSGPSLYDGLSPSATGASDMTFVDSETVYATMTEFDANEHYKQRALEFVIDNPRRSIELAFIKAGRFLSLTPNASGFTGGPIFLICLGWYVIFWLLVLAGVREMRRKRAVVVLLTAPFLQFLLVHMVFVGSVRYRLPLEFPLSVLAGAGAVAYFRWFRSLNRVR